MHSNWMSWAGKLKIGAPCLTYYEHVHWLQYPNSSIQVFFIVCHVIFLTPEKLNQPVNQIQSSKT